MPNVTASSDESIHQLQTRLHTALEGLKKHLSREVSPNSPSRTASPSPSSQSRETKVDLRKKLQEVHRALQHAKAREESYQAEVGALKAELEFLREDSLRKHEAVSTLEKAIEVEIEGARNQVRTAVHSRTIELSQKLKSALAEIEDLKRIHRDTTMMKDARVKDLEMTVELLTKAGQRQAEEIIMRDQRITELQVKISTDRFRAQHSPPQTSSPVASLSSYQEPQPQQSPQQHPSTHKTSPRHRKNKHNESTQSIHEASQTLQHPEPITNAQWPELQFSNTSNINAASMKLPSFKDAEHLTPFDDPVVLNLPPRFPHQQPTFTTQIISNVNLLNGTSPAAHVLPGYLSYNY